jgi:adenylate kinase family enzyme
VTERLDKKLKLWRDHMAGVIILFGAPGAGSTTLGRELAQRLGFLHIDLDEYVWRWDTEVPYTAFRPQQEWYEHIMGDIAKSKGCVMSGSLGDDRHLFESLFDLAVYVTAPSEIRTERLRTRTCAQFGSRVLPGGDMCERNNKFIESAADYETNFRSEQHEQWIRELPCCVLRVDGAKSIDENVKWIAEQYLSIAAES